MVTYEASLRRRREAVYQATRRNRPSNGSARDLLHSFVLLLLLACVVTARVYLAVTH